MKLLIVDDSSVMRRTIERHLADYEIDIVGMAANGLEALNLVKTKQPDVVSLDITMPEMDGLEATRRIRMIDGDIADAPIVALTANAMAADRERCLAAGMNDFMAKPFDPAQLTQMLERWAAPAPRQSKAS